MTNYISLQPHYGRGRMMNKNYIRYETLYDTSWFGYDLSEKPVSLCLRDSRNGLVLYSTLLYQFKDREEARRFCLEKIENGEARSLLEELKAHTQRLNIILGEKLRHDSAPFYEILKRHGISLAEFFEIREEFNALPAHLKAYLRRREKGDFTEMEGRESCGIQKRLQF